MIRFNWLIFNEPTAALGDNILRTVVTIIYFLERGKLWNFLESSGKFSGKTTNLEGDVRKQIVTKPASFL